MNLTPLLGEGWLQALLPELILCVGGMLLILIDAFSPKARGVLSALAVIIFVATSWAERVIHGGTFFGGSYQISEITQLFDMTFLLAAILATLFAGVIPGYIALSFVAYQPGVVTEPRHLRALVKGLLADYELAGEFFDA